MNSKETKIFLLLEIHKKMICLLSAYDTRSLRDKDDCVVRESGSCDWSVGGVCTQITEQQTAVEVLTVSQ